MSAEFIAFCQQHGVLLEHTPPVGRWVRVKTTDKRHKRNGAVKFLGDFGLVQNWAHMERPALWHSKQANTSAIDFVRVQKQAALARQEASHRAKQAAARAVTMLAKAKQDYHPYLASKGFKDQCGAILDGQLLIPMFAQGSVCGLQVIQEDGQKRFLPGQRCSGASFVMGSKQGLTVLCEGYATGLSAAAVLKTMKQPASIHVGFSAGNLPKLAERLPRGIVLADNDKSGTGQRIAQQIGWPYWISDRQGEDFNDAHQRLGNFPLTMQLMEVIRKV